MHLTRAFPSLSADKILELHRQASGTAKKGPKGPGCTTGGPSRRSLILRFGDSNISFNVIAMALSRHLVSIKSRIRVESFRPAYGGLLITTTFFPFSSDIQVVEDFVCTQVLKGSVVECEVFFFLSQLFIYRCVQHTCAVHKYKYLQERRRKKNAYYLTISHQICVGRPPPV